MLRVSEVQRRTALRDWVVVPAGEQSRVVFFMIESELRKDFIVWRRTMVQELVGLGVLDQFCPTRECFDLGLVELLAPILNPVGQVESKIRPRCRAICATNFTTDPGRKCVIFWDDAFVSSAAM